MIRAQANREAVNQLKRPAKREDRKASVWTAMLQAEPYAVVLRAFVDRAHDDSERRH